MNYPNVEVVLNRMGLWKAVRGIPGMVAIVLIFVALAHVALSSVPAFSALSLTQFNLSAVAIGTVLALIGYFLGNFWDAVVFDPLYGPSGRWVGRSTRPLGLFPAGDDLQRVRQSAAAKLVPNEPQGKGVYRAALELARKSKAQWERIEQPLILSKFLRALIWPAGIASLALLGHSAWSTNFGDEGGTSSMVLGLGSGLVCLLLFVPYINLRVEHMQRLYEHGMRAISSR